MKKCFLITGMVVFVFCLGFYLSAQLFDGNRTKGDVNEDGEVNILDALRAVNIILGVQPPPTQNELWAADCNGDEQTNIIDVLGIVNVALDISTCVSSCDEIDCNDDNPCTGDYCDSLLIQCFHDTLPSGISCDDGDACTENDQCVDGKCQGIPRNCDDGNGCTHDSCDPLTGCVYAEICCDDGIDNDGDGNNDCNDGDCLVDGDGDGFDAEPCGDDCDDSDLDIYLGAAEICGDGKDNDCDGDSDFDDADCSCGTVTDIDGNVYRTVIIGSQCWMAENLKVTHYRNGDPILNVTDNTEWTGLSTGAYCNYNNDSGNVSTYGRLYNWYAVKDIRNIAPTGWHVPTDEEWKELEMYLGMSQSQADAEGLRGTDEGGKMKEAGTSHWYSPNTGATNESGFTALPGGYRMDYAFFRYLGSYATFWSFTGYSHSHAWYRHLYHGRSDVSRASRNKLYGLSVRCVRD